MADNPFNSLRPPAPRPSPSARIAAPLSSPTARRLLDAWVERAAVQTGLAEREYQAALARGLIAPTYHVTVDLWRALDALQGRVSSDAHVVDGGGVIAAVPQWLLDADLQAQADLAAWYPARGLPAPSETEDPGDPDPREALVDYPRPDPGDPRGRLVEWLKCRRDVVYFIDNYGHLAHKVRGVIPFRLWRWQAWLLHQWHANPLSITLKARQLGASEMAAAYCAWTILFHDTKSVLMLSKREDDAAALLERAVISLDFLPHWLKPGSAESVSVSILGRRNTTVFEIVHADAAGRAHPSVIMSLPATQGAGRSLTAALVILDEWAWQMWAMQIWTSIKPTADGGGRIIGLSTAKGVGNLFHQLWVYATDSIGAQGSETLLGDGTPAPDDRASRFGRFFAAFLSWRRHPERDEAWYAAEAREKARIGQPELLHQEYPSEPTQAFVQSGRNVFDVIYLQRHSERIRAEIAERAARGEPNFGRWQAVDGLTLYESPREAVYDEQGALVEARHTYLLAADVAEGLPGGDYDCAVVIDRTNGLEVAWLYGHWDPAEYARRLERLGRLFFDAQIAVERNNHGHAVLLALTQIHHYPNLYHHSEPHIPGRPADRRAGWLTTPTTKPMAIDKLRELLASDGIFPRTLTFLNEALVFATRDNGSMGAPEGYHDDTVAAFWIAAFLLTRPGLTDTVMDFIRGRAALTQAALGQHLLKAQSGLPAGAVVESTRGPGAQQGADNQSGPTVLTGPAAAAAQIAARRMEALRAQYTLPAPNPSPKLPKLPQVHAQSEE